VSNHGDQSARDRRGESRRSWLRDDAEVLRAYGACFPDQCGGLSCFGDKGDEVFEIRFTGDLQTHAARLAGLVSRPERLRVVRCEWTMAQLFALRDTILGGSAGARGRRRARMGCRDRVQACGRRYLGHIPSGAGCAP